MYIQKDKSLEIHPLPPFVTTVNLGTLSFVILEDVLQGVRWGGYWQEDACDVGAVECNGHVT